MIKSREIDLLLFYVNIFIIFVIALSFSFTNTFKNENLVNIAFTNNIRENIGEADFIEESKGLIDRFLNSLVRRHK